MLALYLTVEVVAAVVVQLFYYKMIYCRVWLPAVVAAVEQVIIVMVATVPGPMDKLPQGSMVNRGPVIQVTVVAVGEAVEDTMAAPAEVAMVGHMAGGQVPAILVDKREIPEPAGVLPIQMDSIPVVEHQADSRESQCRQELGKVGSQEATAEAMGMQ